MSRRMAGGIEPKCMAIQRQGQEGQTQLAIGKLEGMLSQSRWQVLLKGQIHAQIGLLAYASGDDERASTHL